MAQVNTVLLIDDDEINNLICTKIIKKNNFSEQVVACLSARQGLTYLMDALGNESVRLPEVIFLDINMPVMNGWDFLEQYRQITELENKNIILIMLSSSAYVHDINRAKGYPQVSDYIIKPLTNNHLQQIVKKFFDHPTHEQ